MISLLDYLDNDVSELLSHYIHTRRDHNDILREINQLIDINICSEYLKSFDACKYSLHGKERLEFANYLLTSNTKTNLVYNWPTKYPSFYKNIFRRSNQKRDTLIKVSDEDYIIEDTGWKLKTFPPNKDKYPIHRLITMKKK